MFKQLICLLVCSTAILFAADQTSNNINLTKSIKANYKLSDVAQKCVACHADKTPGIVADWKNSRHAHVGVSCLDCHSVPQDSPMITKGEHPKDSGIFISVLVSPKTCSKCHEQEVAQFDHSGHGRGALQMYAKKGMVNLMRHFEGADHPDLKFAPEATGCIQCHGSIIKLDKNKRPTKETWPNYGIGTAFPDGSVGNCASCHSSHKFSIAESRKPAACASCHLGPDHPDIEIFNNSMHGHIYNSEGSKWDFTAAPDTWTVPDFRAPTCAACHMSGVGDNNTTHNVSERLKWNLWAPISKQRTGGWDTAAEIFTKTGKITAGNPLAGNPKGPEVARASMKNVCKVCHTTLHTDNFFTMADQQVELYNYYFEKAMKLKDELKAKGLLGPDPWADEFQVIMYHMWHHEGRRMRQGAMMGAPDYSHWHGVFEVQQDIRKLQKIYNKRIKTGKIED